MTRYTTLPDSFGGRRKPGWCLTHQDFAWGYPDGSTQCFFDCVVEGAGDPCRFVAGSVDLPRGTVKRRRKRQPSGGEG